MTERFDELRSMITANDAVIVAAVNARLRLVREVWALKRELGLDQLDAGRERTLRAELAAANEGPLSAEGLDALVTELLQLTKREMDAG